MSAESAIQPVFADHADHVEAALSALLLLCKRFPGALPQASDDAAPLALNTDSENHSDFPIVTPLFFTSVTKSSMSRSVTDQEHINR
jgi:hypothetical protein